MSSIEITFNHSFTLSFACFQSTISERWLAKLHDAINHYEIDDRERFYGFSVNDKQLALQKITNTIDTINKHNPIIKRTIQSLDDIDTLNYLHHMFEVHHGLLDQAPDDFNCFPLEYQKALSQLNIDVHRCESVGRGGNKPRFVVTYFNQPKTEYLTDTELGLMTNTYEFGTIYLNYVEIGKTLEDLARDNDQYISDDAFKPFINFSSDFNVKFWDSNPTKVTEMNTMMTQYYENNADFFEHKGYARDHLHLRAGSIPVARLITDLTREEVITKISGNQIITYIKIK
jgi:hypothetical protein